MNFLGHAWLSRNYSAETQLGNMMGDFLENPKVPDWNSEMRQGLAIHRHIDQYTDSHPCIREIRAIFFPHIRHYSGVIADVLLDHYLGRHWGLFHPKALETFCLTFHETLEQKQQAFTPDFQQVFGYMKSQAWLEKYGDKSYMAQTIHRFQKRRPNFNSPEQTIELWLKHYPTIEGLSLEFLPSIEQEISTVFPNQ